MSTEARSEADTPEPQHAIDAGEVRIERSRDAGLVDPSAAGLRVRDMDSRDRLNASLVTAIAISLITLLLTLVRMHERDMTGMMQPSQTMAQVLDFYLFPVTLQLVTLAIAGWFGAFRGWASSALAGIVGAVVGGALGYALRILVGGRVALDGTAWGVIFGEFLGLNFPLLVFSTLTAAIAGPLLWRRLTGVRAESSRFVAARGEAVALVRIPATADHDANDAATAGKDEDATGIDAANAQWEDLVASLEEHGWATREVPADEDAAGALIGSEAVTVSSFALFSRASSAGKALSRSAIERSELGSALTSEGAIIEVLEAPATLNARDLLEVDATLYVGITERTNAAAVRQLRRLGAAIGYRVVAVPLVDGFTLRDVAAALPDGSVIAYPDAFDGQLPFAAAIEMSEPAAGSVLALDEAVVLVATSAPSVTKELRARGFDVVDVDVSEFERIGGTLSSLILRAAG